MLDYFLKVDMQILSMTLMVIIGYIAYKKKIITEKGVSDMSQLLLKFVTPMVIISAFQREFSLVDFKRWSVMLGVTILSYVIQIIIAAIVYKKKEKIHCRENRTVVVFGNNGFMAIPLFLALVGEEGVFLGSTNIAIFNILLWTYGIKTLKDDMEFNLKKAILTPGMIGVVLGILLFVSPWKLPQPIYQTVSVIADLNTPMAMIVLGGFLAQTNLSQGLKNMEIYVVSFVKLIATPLIMIAVLYFMPISMDMKAIATICSVTPAAIAISMMANITDKDYKYASGTVAITSILAAVTMPIMMTLAKVILGF